MFSAFSEISNNNLSSKKSKSSNYKSLFSTLLSTFKSNKGDIQEVNPTNRAYLQVSDITTFTDTWICTKDNKLLRNGTALKVAVSGTQPTTCERIATNSNQDLFVISKNKLYMFKKITTSSYAWVYLNLSNVEDITIGINDEVYYINTSGVIYKYVYSDDPKDNIQFNTSTYGANCRIAFAYDAGQTIYLVDKIGDLYKIQAKTKTKLYPSIYAKDVCVTNRSDVIVAGSDGIFIKKGEVESFVKIGDGIASDLSCYSSLWFIGSDNYVYESSLY